MPRSGLACVVLVSLAACPGTSEPKTSSAVTSTPAPATRAAFLAREVEPQRLLASVTSLASFGTRHTLSDVSSTTRGIGAARRWLKSELDAVAAASGRSGDLAMEVSFDAHTLKADGKRVPHDLDLVNVVATLPGAMPSARSRRYYVVGHYDSRTTDVMDATSDAPGANDDASGTAVVLELARVLSKKTFDATIVFVATAGEEQGLYGAKVHAEMAKGANLDVRAVLSNDIVGDPSPLAGGTAHTDAVRVFSEGIPVTADPGAVEAIRKIGAESDSPSRELARYVADVADAERTPVRPMLVFRPDRFLRGGDHMAFAERGFPAIRFTTVDEHFDRQHAPTDLPRFVDPAYLTGVAILNGAALVHLANAPSPPPAARIVTSELMNDTLLRWSPSPEPDVAGYEIVWRATTSPRWDQSVDVGPRTEARVPVSKDDVVFGVRAYDRDGYRSPVALAQASAT